MKNFIRKAYSIKLSIISIFSFLSNIKYGGNENGYDLCITTHGNRFIFIGIALDSFARDGKQFIRKVFITVDYEEKLNWYKLLIIKKLKSKGCVIVRGKASGPHSKYIHYLKNNWDGIRSFFMIDDDVIYDPLLINYLFYESKKYKFCICARCKRIGTYGLKLKPYLSWSILEKDTMGYKVFPTNVGGSVIKKDFAIFLLDFYDEALKYSPTADDIWFHWLSVKYDKPFKNLSSFKSPISVIPFSQQNTLSSVNLTNNNDTTIEKLYTEEIVKKIKSKIQSYEI